MAEDGTTFSNTAHIPRNCISAMFINSSKFRCGIRHNSSPVAHYFMFQFAPLAITSVVANSILPTILTPISTFKEKRNRCALEAEFQRMRHVAYRIYRWIWNVANIYIYTLWICAYIFINNKTRETQNIKTLLSRAENDKNSFVAYPVYFCWINV